MQYFKLWPIAYWIIYVLLVLATATFTPTGNVINTQKSAIIFGLFYWLVPAIFVFCILAAIQDILRRMKEGQDKKKTAFLLFVVIVIALVVGMQLSPIWF